MVGSGEELLFAGSAADEVLLGGRRCIVGQTVPMQKVFSQIRLAASTPLPVLIEGESGTGKELVARAIHGLSPRARAPFLALNAPAVPDTLLEAELFGVRRGAFTGATEHRDGVFAAASGGVLFLDEIASMTPLLQVKLLRVLQEGEVTPLGGTRAVSVDVRLIAATNQRLDKAVESGTFRADLYYRLDVLQIRLPPLRERMDDIPLLAKYFLAKLARECELPPKTLAASALEVLGRHSWKGNVRELQNVIARAFVNSPGEEITHRDICVGGQPPASSWKLPEGLESLSYSEAKERVLCRFQHEYLRRLFSACGGNVTHAARRAGITRAAFRRIFQKACGSCENRDHCRTRGALNRETEATRDN